MLKDPPPNPKPEPLGVAVFPLLEACHVTMQWAQWG